MTDWFRENGDTRPIHRMFMPDGSTRYSIGGSALGSPLPEPVFNDLLAAGIIKLETIDERYSITDIGFGLIQDRDLSKRKIALEAEIARHDQVKENLQAQLDELKRKERP